MSHDLIIDDETSRIMNERLIEEREKYKADSERFELEYIEMAGRWEKQQWRAEKAERERNELLELCKEALAKCPFPVGAAILKEKIQATVMEMEDKDG